jgi:proteic killer suppression protein
MNDGTKTQHLRALSNAGQGQTLEVGSNRLEALKGDRAGQHSIRIDDQWRICFRFVDGNALDVEITGDH